MDINRLREKCQGYAQCFDTIEKRVTLCATEVIDTAMSEKNPNWFSAFRGKELKLPENAIIERRHNTIRDLDFQPAIKLFLFRESKVDYGDADTWNISYVFEKYNLPRTYSADKPSRFKKIVGNLVFSRNELTGHLSAEEIEARLLTASEKELENIIFKYSECIHDLISFLSYFPDAKGIHPEPHFDYAKRLFAETEHKYDIAKYKMSEVIEKERLGISEDAFADFCRQIHVNTSTEMGIRYFETDDYDRVVRVIRTIIENGGAKPPAEPRPNYLPAIAIIATLLVVLTVLLILLIPRLRGKTSDNDSSSSKPSYSQKAPGNTSSGSSDISTPTTSKKTKIKGEVSLGTLDLSIDQRVSNSFMINVKNNGSTRYALGWVQKANVVIETSEKTYYGTLVERPSTYIDPGSTGVISINLEETIEGDIEKIIIKNIIPLSESGLPAQTGSTGLTAIMSIEYY